jgi:AP-4 complex subunit sigma-1
MYDLEKVHFVLDEMIMNGYIVETNKSNILKVIDLVDRESKKDDGLFR